MVLAGVAFSFKQQGIDDEELVKTATLIGDLEGENERKEEVTSSALSSESEAPWELLINRPDFRMWRRPIPNHSYLCEYKCAGTYRDISSAAFFIAQMDLQYRKEWDDLVISLDVVDRDARTGSEIVRWVTHFPYPMYPREYVYVRRACVDSDRKMMVLVSKAVEHPRCPVSQKEVRVSMYSSQMVIRPHGDFDKLGLDYVMTYYDDPLSPFPTPAYKWMVKYGVPGFVDKVYRAAKALHERLDQYTVVNDKSRKRISYYEEDSASVEKRSLPLS